jgi:hypothetical protein
VFTHFPPADTYNATISGLEVARAERQYREKGRGTTSLLLFGYGDGGGGPNRDMLAAAHRLRSLEGSPTVGIDSPAAFFSEAEAEYPDAPVWSCTAGPTPARLGPSRATAAVNTCCERPSSGALRPHYGSAILTLPPN